MVLVHGVRLAIVEAREEPVDDARTVGVKVVADGRHRPVADDHRLLDKVVVTEAAHGGDGIFRLCGWLWMLRANYVAHSTWVYLQLRGWFGWRGLLLLLVLLLHALLVFGLPGQRFLVIGCLVDFAFVAQAPSHQRVQIVAGAEEASEGFLNARTHTKHILVLVPNALFGASYVLLVYYVQFRGISLGLG